MDIHSWLTPVSIAGLLFGAACAAKSGGSSEPSPEAARVFDWSNVTKLSVGTPVRVTKKDGERTYGRLMVATRQELTLELEAGSRTMARETISLVERFPTSFPQSLPRAAVGVGAALSLSSSSAPNTYQRSVAPAQENLDQATEPTHNGIYIDTAELVGQTAQMVDRAIESTRKTVVVYRSR
jgi:hypothetical protein